MIVMILSTEEVKDLVNGIKVTTPIHTEPTISISPAAAEQMVKDAVAKTKAECECMKAASKSKPVAKKSEPVKAEQPAKESAPVIKECAQDALRMLELAEKDKEAIAKMKTENVEVAAEILPDPQPSAPAEAPKEAEPITEEEPKAEPEKPVIKRSTAKRKLDDGKIFALRRAGWTWDKIADEMNCSIQTAINHYNEYTKER